MTPEPVSPPPPWHLSGYGLLIPRWVGLGNVRPSLPPDVRPVPLAPGRTLGAVLCTRYRDGSTLCYDELIVSTCLARRSGRFGWWIHRIYVNEARALAGGREFWGLPKQFARFTWNWPHRSVRVQSLGGRTLLDVRGPAKVGAVSLPLPAIGPFLTNDAQLGHRAWARGTLRVRPQHGLMQSEESSTTRVRMLVLEKLRLTIDSPH